MPGGRTGCRGPPRSTRWRARPPRRRGCGWSVSRATRRRSVTTSRPTRWPASPTTCRRCAPRWCGWPRCSRRTDVIVTAGGSTYFDAVADVLTGDWPEGLAVRTIVRSGAYLTHDDGLYARTSPLRAALRPALQVWAQVVSRPESGLAVLTMGRRDVSFDQDLPVPLRACRQRRHQAQRSARVSAAGRGRQRRGRRLARVRHLASVHGVRQVAAHPRARRRRPRRRPDPHVLLAISAR